MSGDIVERLRWLGSIDCPYGCDEVGNPAADLLDAIDAQVAAYMNDSIGSSAAIQAISRLLHPMGGPS